MSPLPEVDSATNKNTKAGDPAHVEDDLINGKDLYFDMSPVPIPPGHRITAMRLRKLVSPSNRIGIEVTTVKGVPGEPETERTECHQGDNSLYIDKIKTMGELYLSTVETVASENKCIVGINLANVRTSDRSSDTLGIQLWVRTIGSELARRVGHRIAAGECRRRAAARAAARKGMRGGAAAATPRRLLLTAL